MSEVFFSCKRMTGIEHPNHAGKTLILQGFVSFVLHFVLHRLVESLGEIVVDRLGNFHIFFIDDMLIHIFQHIVGGMPHTFHGVFIWYVVHQHHGSIIVSQRFEVDLLQTQFISESGHFIGDPDGSQSEQRLICFLAL